MTTPTDKIREQTKLRQRKFYSANKDSINEKRRETYRLGRLAAKGIAPAAVAAPPPPSVEPLAKNIVVVNKPTFTDKNNKPMLDYSKTKVLTADELIANLHKIVPNDSSLITYKSDTKRLVKMTNNENIIDILSTKNTQKTLKAIANGKKNNGEPYAQNSEKMVLQLCVLLLDRLNIRNTKIKQYKEAFELAKLVSIDNTKKNQQVAPIYSLKTYSEKVKEQFGAKSQMAILTELYAEMPVRDDFVLKIVGTEAEAAKDESINYAVVPRAAKTPIKIVINKYKTANKYGAFTETLSKGLSAKIRIWMSENKLKSGDYLFGDKTLSSYVSNNNKKICVTGGISEFRHMIVSDFYRDKPHISPQDRIQLAKQMKHAPATALMYIRDNQKH